MVAGVAPALGEGSHPAHGEERDEAHACAAEHHEVRPAAAHLLVEREDREHHGDRAAEDRLVERREVLALEVLDDGDLERRVVVDLLDHGRDRLESRHLRGAPSALAGDELVAAALDGTDEDRLQDAVLLDARRELGERRLVEGQARLVRIRLDAPDRHLADAGRARRAFRGEEADDGWRELALLREPPCGGASEVRPGQVRSPPVPTRGRCERRPTCWRRRSRVDPRAAPRQA